ncbi:MAG: hypothetical protein ABSA10_10315, partial [Anaerolineales bacterium]
QPAPVSPSGRPVVLLDNLRALARSLSSVLSTAPGKPGFRPIVLKIFSIYSVDALLGENKAFGIILHLTILVSSPA